MIEGHNKSEASSNSRPGTSSATGSISDEDDKSLAKSKWQPCASRKWLENSTESFEKFTEVGLTNLPHELLVKILSNMDIRSVSACRCVNRRWQALVDENYLQALSFSRCFDYQPIPQTVKHYHSLTRSWLTGFSNEGKELTEQLDKLQDNKHFPKLLFFGIAGLFAKTKFLTCQEVCTLHHANWVSNASFSPDGCHLVTVANDCTAKIWGLVDGQWQEKVTIRCPHWVDNANFSPDGSHLVIASIDASHDGTAQIWGLVDGQWQHKATIRHLDDDGYNANVKNARFSPDGNRLVTASADGTAKIFELVDGQWQEKAIIRHSSRLFNMVINASFSPDGIHLVTAATEGTAKIWGLVAGQWQEKATIEHSDWVRDASFSPPHGRYLVTVCDDETAKIWELVAGQWQERAIIRHSLMVIDAKFSPDGSHLVTTSTDHTAKICKLIDGQWQQIATILHSDKVFTASFSPDGRHFMTASDDCTVKIWGLVAGKWQEKVTLRHPDKVRSASFSPDGSHLVISTYSHAAKIWLLKSKESNDISEHVTAELTQLNIA